MAARRPGQFTLRPRIDPLTPGDTDRIDLRTVAAGPSNKPRYLRKYVPFGAVVVDSYSDSVRLEAAVNGGEYMPVPQDSARTFDSVPVNSISIRNPSGSGADVAAKDIEIILFTNERKLQEEGTTFSLGNVLKDLVPGVR